VNWFKSASPARVEATQSDKPKLILFIHGFKGSGPTTFGSFPDFIRNDPEIAVDHNVETYDYDSSLSKIGGSPTIDQVASDLKTKLETSYRPYKEIVIVAHSLGGLVTRRTIADILLEESQSGTRLRIKRVVYFSSPHLGALAAKLGSIAATAISGAISSIPQGGPIKTIVKAAVGLGPSAQVQGLAYDSTFLLNLMKDEAAVRASERVNATFVLGGKDWVVGPTSAMGPGGATNYKVIVEADHFSIVKPSSAKDTAVEIVRQAVLNRNVAAAWDARADLNQPRLSRMDFDQDADTRRANRFVYWSRSLHYIGRESEEAKLATFLGGIQNFRWMLLWGPGGAGKSRLALELILAQSSGWWNAGFLDLEQAANPDWALWQPMLPTLFIIDDLVQHVDGLSRLLRGLAERETPHQLRCPVRVLIIARESHGAWSDNILVEPRVKSLRSDDLQLNPLSDAWPIFEQVLGSTSALVERREQILAEFAAIDRNRTPLFAHLMADAMSSGQDVNEWSRTALLEEVLKRNRIKFWVPAAESLGFGIGPAAIAKEERLLAFATMVGSPAWPLTIEDLNKCSSSLLPRWDLDRHPKLFNVMTGADAHLAVPPLEPDIVGEYFVLEQLAALGNHSKELVELAWQNSPQRVAAIVRRCHRDALGDPGLPLLRRAPRVEDGSRPYASVEEWMATCHRLVADLKSKNMSVALQIFVEATRELEQLEATYPRKLGELSAKWLNLVLEIGDADPSDLGKSKNAVVEFVVRIVNTYPRACCHMFMALNDRFQDQVSAYLEAAFDELLVGFGALPAEVDSDEESERDVRWNEALWELLTTNSYRAPAVLDYAAHVQGWNKIYEDWSADSKYPWLITEDEDIDQIINLIEKYEDKEALFDLLQYFDDKNEPIDEFLRRKDLRHICRLLIELSGVSYETAYGYFQFWGIQELKDPGLDKCLVEVAAELARNSEKHREIEHYLKTILSTDRWSDDTSALEAWADVVADFAIKLPGAGHQYGWDSRVERLVEKEQWLHRLRRKADEEAGTRRDLILSEWLRAEKGSDDPDDLEKNRLEAAFRLVLRGAALDFNDRGLLELWTEAAALSGLCVDANNHDYLNVLLERGDTSVNLAEAKSVAVATRNERMLDNWHHAAEKHLKLQAAENEPDLRSLSNEYWEARKLLRS